MRWIALPAGVVILLFTLLDVFRTLVMPRAARGRFRLSRVLFRPMWRPWRWLGVRRSTMEGRERILATAAPFFFFVLLVAWAGSALVGYALVLWSPAFVHGLHGEGGRSFGNALYSSGSSLFTLGFGNVVGPRRIEHEHDRLGAREHPEIPDEVRLVRVVDEDQPTGFIAMPMRTILKSNHPPGIFSQKPF